MRRKSGSRLAILIGVFSLVSGAGYAAWFYQVQRMAHSVALKAERAEKEGRIAEAEDLYRQHLEVIPDDADVKIRLADALLKEKTPKRQEEALRLYNEALTPYPWRDDVRRKAAEVAIDLGRFEFARGCLSILRANTKRASAPVDGGLEFLMGRCYEEDKDAADAGANAAKHYQDAIDHNVPAPLRLEAYRRLAGLLRERLKQPVQADQAIEAMVQSEPENHRVYLERGRYRSRFHRPGARDDFKKALALAPREAEVYLDLARAVESESGLEGAQLVGLRVTAGALAVVVEGESALDAARLAGLRGAAGALAVVVEGESALDASRRVLKAGLKAVPNAGGLYEGLARLELRASGVDQAIKVLEGGVEALPDQLGLRLQLALLLAQHGADAKLFQQIEKLRGSNVAPAYVQYLSAYYYILTEDFARARELLEPLQAVTAQNPYFKVNLLLAECYARLGEPELRQQVLERADRANPQDLTARLGLIAGMADRGEIDRAIEEYRRLTEQLPVVVPLIRLNLAHLLTVRNQRLPAPQRNWDEPRRLIDEAEQAAPGSVGPLIRRSQLLWERNGPGDRGAARELLAGGRSRFPQSIELWSTEVELLWRQGQLTEAMGLLDQAQRLLGDQVELRLLRAQLSVASEEPQARSVLNELAMKLEPFSKGDRRRLLDGLAGLLAKLHDIPGASRLWSQLAEQEPNDLELRLKLLDLAFQSADRKAIEKNIQVVERIDELMGRYCQVRYLIWQAEHAGDKNSQQVMRIEARSLLAALKSRRPDWSLIPKAEADLLEQELAQEDLDGAKKLAKQESLIIAYNQEINLGQRDPKHMGRAVQLLLSAGRVNEAIQTYSRIPGASQAAVVQLLLVAGRVNEAFQTYNRIPGASQAGGEFWQMAAKILPGVGRPADVETELRKVIALAKGDPDRWLFLVNFMIQSRQLDRAVKAVQEAETNLAQQPLALAQCCENLGRAYEGTQAGDQAKKWYDRAEQWYAKAQTAQPKTGDDLLIARRLVGFFVRIKQISKAEKLIQSYAGRSGVAPQYLEDLAGLAESIDRFDLAEQLYNRLASEPAVGPQGKLKLAGFFGRQGHFKEALDLCESLRSDASLRESATLTGVQIVCTSKDPFNPIGFADEAQINRVVGWLEQGLVADPKATRLLIGLGFIREWQESYPKAEALFRRAIDLKDQSGIAYNNLAFLMALKREKLGEALESSNQAIKLKGPLHDFLDTRGVVYLTIGDYRQAIADLDAAVTASPSDSKYFHLAQAYLVANDRDRAKQCLKAAKAMGLPAGLHRLERTPYKEVLDQLEAP